MARLGVARAVAALFLVPWAVHAVLPPGYEDELYCPPSHCMRRKDMPAGFTGPSSAFHDCIPEGASAGGQPQRPAAWGFHRGEEAKQELLDRGFHQRRCGTAEPAEAGEAEEVCTRGQAKPAVHAAFYLWYGNPEVDGRWLHWNHKVLPHWDPQVDAQHPKFDWRPPEEPHSPFMPARGTYSCRDNATLRAQFADLAVAGVDSAMCSWWGRKDWKGKRDDANSGANTDELMPAVLEAAHLAGVFVSFHIEPYGGRTPETFLDDLRYIHEHYGSHPAVWRESPRGLPLFWLYDVSAEHSAKDVAAWRRALDSVRGTPLDGIFLCLWIGGGDDALFVEEAGFDGAYTYFAATGFTQGSTPSMWPAAMRELQSRGKLFVPAVGPGYDDSRVRPWNRHNARDRQNGQYYDRMWSAAVQIQPHAISVTSYNEWGEGTQIEGSVPYTSPSGLKHLDYSPEAPDFYLKRTRHWSDRYKAAGSCGAAEP